MSLMLPLAACPQEWSNPQPWEDWNRCLPAPQPPCSSLQLSTAHSALLLQASSRGDGWQCQQVANRVSPVTVTSSRHQLEAAGVLKKGAAAAAAATK